MSSTVIQVAVWSGAQHGVGLVEEGRLAGDRQPHELALGDVDAEAVEHGQKTRDRALALMILSEHEALQLGTEVARNAARQRRHDGSAVRQLPALAAVERGHRPDDQVLNQELLVALEAGALGQAFGLDHGGVGDRHLGSLGATAPLATLALRRPRRLLHAARPVGLDRRTTVEAFEPRNLVTQLGVLGFEAGIVLQGLHQQRLQLVEASPIDAG